MPTKKRYEHKITLGKDIDGNLIRKSFYSTKSKRDAKRKAEEYAETYKIKHFLGEPEKAKRSLLKSGQFVAWNSIRNPTSSPTHTRIPALHLSSGI